MSIKKVFVTGGCGFLGSYVTKQLVEKGYEVLVFDAFLNYLSPFQSNYHHFMRERMKDVMDHIRLERGDIRVQKRVFQLMQEWKPDAVIHLAALPSAKESTMYPSEALQINIDGTLSVLEGIKSVGDVQRFIFASSSFVYGHFTTPTADETHPTSPIDVYGGSKLTGEILSRAYSAQHNFEHVVIRPSAVYGFGDCNRRVTQLLIENAINGKPLVLHNGGEDRIDFSYATDVADGFILAMEKPEAANQTFNLTRGNARQVKEFAQEVKKHYPEAELVTKPPDAMRPKRGTLDISKARELLGYDPKVDIEEGVAEYIGLLKERGPKEEG